MLGGGRGTGRGAPLPHLAGRASVAIYRPSKPRWPALLGAAVIGLLLGLGAGFLLRTVPDPVEVARDLRADLDGAAGLLEVAQVEYEESVSGSRVTDPREYRAARAALSRSRDRFGDVRPALEALSDPVVGAIDAGYDRTQDLMAEPAQPSRVREALERLAGLLTLTPS
jgi:hypothetical protein